MPSWRRWPSWDSIPTKGFFQTQRFDRYREVISQWLQQGKAYHCYYSKEELDGLRDQQMTAGERVRYDGRCPNITAPRAGVEHVVRFRNSLDGEVVVNDSVRGRVVFENDQLDELIIARSDGTHVRFLGYRRRLRYAYYACHPRLEAIRRKGIVYVGLDAMTDTTVPSAMGNSMFADLVSVAGHIYKHGVRGGSQRSVPTISLHAENSMS